MNWQTYLPTPEQIEADNALVDAALDRLTNFIKIQFDGMTGNGNTDRSQINKSSLCNTSSQTRK